MIRGIHHAVGFDLLVKLTGDHRFCALASNFQRVASVYIVNADRL
jgi:hypothetical protein